MTYTFYAQSGVYFTSEFFFFFCSDFALDFTNVMFTVKSLVRKINSITETKNRAATRIPHTV